MSKPLVDRIPFAKIVIVLAIAFGVSLGLCGLTLALSVSGARQQFGVNQIAGVAAILSLPGMLLSAIGLVVTCAAWVVLSIVKGFSPKDEAPQHLFDDKNDVDKPK
jgi:hypothetical protein